MNLLFTVTYIEGFKAVVVWNYTQLTQKYLMNIKKLLTKISNSKGK